MVASKAATVDAYLAELPEAEAAVVGELRRAIGAWVPGLREEMRYGMPTFLTAEVFLALAAQKRYFCLYFCNPELLAQYRTELGKLSTGKGCVRFKSLDQLPMNCIEAMVRAAAAHPGYRRC